MEDVFIVGAGPAGSFLARKLKEAGISFRIIDKKKKIGYPVQCTGLVSILGAKEAGFSKFAEKSLINKVSSAKFVAGKQSFYVKGKEKKAYVLDRAKFDKLLACGLGVEKEEFIALTDKSIILKNKVVKRPSFVIGADGPLSSIRKYITNEKPSFLHALQIRAKGKFNPDCVELHFLPYINFFGWVVPEDSKYARIGLADSLGENIDLKFNKFLKKLKIKSSSSVSSGLIPISKPFRKIKTKSLAIVGDAASQVKATTGGGIVFGLKAANKLGLALSKQNLRLYDVSDLNKELSLHYLISKKWFKKPLEQKQELFKEIKKRGINKRMGDVGKMDKASSIFKAISFRDYVALSKFLL